MLQSNNEHTLARCSPGPIGRLANIVPDGRRGPAYLVICLGLLCLALYMGQQQIAFLKRASHMTATVIGHRFLGGSEDSESSKISLVEFEYNGKKYGHDLQADGKLEEGDEVPVLIDPDNPEKAIVDNVFNKIANILAIAFASLCFGFLSLLRFKDFRF